MKKLIALILIFIFSSILYSQQSPQEYLNKIPELPQDLCSLKPDKKAEFLSKVDSLDKELIDEISSRKKTVEKKYKSSAEEMKQNMAEQYGLSSEDIEKLKNHKKMSKAEKKALADKVLQKKANISMEEIENLKKMSKTGQKAWANAYSAEQMANAQANPDSFKTEQNKNMKTYDLAKEQNYLIQKLHAADEKYLNQMKELDKKDSVATKELEAKRKLLMEEIGNTGNDINIIQQVRVIEKEYCSKLTPGYLEILNERLIALRNSMPDYQRLEEINAELNQKAMEVKEDLSSPGLMQLEAIEGYVSILKSAFKYAKYTFPED